MTPYRLAAAVVLASLLAVLLSTSPAVAVSTDIDRTSAPGVDLWISDYGQIQYSEVCILVNYLDSPIVLQLRDSSGQNVTTFTLGPRSSGLFELTYPDLGRYTLVVGDLTATLLELPRERPTNYLPPPRDAGSWSWTQPPKPTEAYTWTDSAVKSLVASITLINIVLAAAVASFGLLIGAGNKALTKFLVPADFITWCLMALIMLDAIFRLFGDWERLWYLVWVVGYFCGFMLWHVDYILPVMTDCANKSIDVRPVAVYLPDDGAGYCIQTQRNRELIKRLMGVPHRLGTDCGLPNDWVGRFKRPYFPAVKGRLTWVQKIEVSAEPVKLWRFTVKRITTTYRLAHASGVEKAQWLNEAKWYFKLQDRFDRLAVKYNDLLLGHRQESVSITAAMVEHATNVNPSRRVSKWFGLDAGDIDLTTAENSYSEIEDRVTAPQAGISKETPEEAEGTDNAVEGRPKGKAAADDEEEED